MAGGKTDRQSTGILGKLRAALTPSSREDNSKSIENIELGVATALYGLAGMISNGPTITIGNDMRRAKQILNNMLKPRNNVFRVISGDVSKIAKAVSVGGRGSRSITSVVMGNNKGTFNGSLSNIVTVLKSNNNILANNISNPLSRIADTIIEIRNLISGNMQLPVKATQDVNNKKPTGQSSKNNAKNSKKSKYSSLIEELVNSMYMLTEINPAYHKVIVNNLTFLRDILLDEYIDIIQRIQDAAIHTRTKKNDINIFINSISLIINSVRPLASFAIIGPMTIMGTHMLARAVNVIDVILISKFSNEKLRFYKSVVPALLTFSEAVAILGATLIAGALVWKFVTIADVVQFGLALTVMTVTMAAILKGINKIFSNKDAFSLSGDFNKLIVILAGTMIVAGVALKFISVQGAALFVAAILGLTLGVAYVLGKISELLNTDALEISGEFSKIITALAGALIVGGLVMYLPHMGENIAIFGGLLTGFIVAVCGALAVLSKYTSRAVADAQKFAVIVGVIAATLIIGGLVMYLPHMDENITSFATITGVFILGFSAAMFILTKNSAMLGKAIMATAAMSVLVTTIAGLMYIVGKVTNETDNGDLALTATIMCAVVGVFVLFATALAGAPEVLIGVAVIAAVVGTIYIIASAMHKIAETMQIVASIGNISTKWALEVITAFILMASELASSSVILMVASAAAGPVMLVAATISRIARAVSDIANLRIAKYDNNGNIIGYENASGDTFKKASENVGKMVTCLGTALANAVKDSDAFNDGLFEKSPAENAAIAIGKVSSVVFELAQGVKEFSNINFDGKQVDENLKKIITAIPQGIVNGVNAHPEYFRYNGVVPGVVAAIKGLSGELVTLARAVVMYSKGEFQMFKFDSNGNLVPTNETVTLTDDVIRTAGTRISAVIKAVIEAISGTSWYDSYKFQGGDYSVGSTIAKSVSLVGTGITDIFNAVEKLGGIEASTTSLEDLNKGVLNILKQMVNLVKLFTDDSNGVDTTRQWLGLDKLSPAEFFNKYTDEVNESIGNIINVFDNTKITNLFNAFKNISDAYGSAKASMDTIVKTNSNDITKFMTNITNLVQRFTKNGVMYGALESMNQNYSTISLGLINVNATMNRLKGIVDIMHDISTITSDATNNPISNITKAIADINGTIASRMNVQTQFTFDEQSKSLERYVQSINSINIEHIDKFTDLINSLNQLGLNLGGIDKLADALSTNLSAVLDRLANEMQHASDTISAADMIQSQRQKIISESIEKIKNIMNEKITVEITQPEQQQPQIGAGGLFGSLFGGSSESSSQPQQDTPGVASQEEPSQKVQYDSQSDDESTWVRTSVADGSSQRPYYVIISQTQ